ncbi:MAG: outer membrane protein assembly factor BamA [Desulfobacterales bacterium]|nr:outer membrane protein assembly factor BamA [Desulfobacterales bacterium]
MIKHDSTFLKVRRSFKTQVINKLCLIIMVVMGICQQTAIAQQAPSAVILPFDIFAEQDLTYLQTEIPSALMKSLEQAGARVLLLDPVSEPNWKKRVSSIEEIKGLSVQTGGDFIIWGSLTWLGQQFSLDLKLFEASAARPQLYTVEGKGIENLPTSVDKLAQELVLRIFKRQRILEISIDGNLRIEAEAIKRVVKTQPGDIYNPKNLSDDLKAIFAMGYFDDIQILSEPRPDGVMVTFKIKEKPTLRAVRFSGIRWAFEEEEVAEVITAKRGSILNINVIQNDIDRITELYKEENYHNVNVDYKIYERKDNQADIEYIIEEGEKFQIERIMFEGNEAFSDKELKRQMATAEENILSWFTSAGDLDENKLEQDVARLTSFYKNNGYMQARVGEPEVNFVGQEIEITIEINEGPRFRVGEVSLTGDLILEQAELIESLKIRQEEFYNREILRGDVLNLTDLYSNQGFAYADVAPQVKQDSEKRVVDIVFDIKKGQQVYFEKIIISGNTKTRDKVIRRQLRVYEQEQFSSTRLKRSIRNLYRLDYFEQVNVDTSKGSADDKMVLKIDVVEKSTGAFSFGAGYGNADKLYGTISISERNLFGRGQKLELKGTMGSKTQDIDLTFTEPYVWDIPLSGTLTFYNWKYDFEEYDKDSFGFGLSFSYPIFNYTRARLGYVYDIADISNISSDAPGSIKELNGKNTKSSIKSSLRYDSRDSTFVPSEGSNHGFSFEFAGLGGDIGFMKYIGETTYYLPLFWGLVLAPHAEAGYVNKTRTKKLPDYEKFYLGGIGSLRGFKRDDLAPRDNDNNSIGGDKYVQFNLDLTFPLLKDQGVFGGLFFDTGRVYGDNESIELDPGDLRQSAGLGIRWMSPMGPVRLEYGFILDQKETDDGPGNWEFSMASAF